MRHLGWGNDWPACLQLFIQQTLVGQQLKLKQSSGSHAEMVLLAPTGWVHPSVALERTGHREAIHIPSYP